MRKLAVPNKLFTQCLSACVEQKNANNAEDQKSVVTKIITASTSAGANKCELDAALKYAFKKLMTTKTSWWKIADDSPAYKKYLVEERYLVVEALLDAGGNVQILEELFSPEKRVSRLTDLMIARGTQIGQFSLKAICLHAARQGKLELLREYLPWALKRSDEIMAMVALQESETSFKWEIYTSALGGQHIQLLRYLFASYCTLAGPVGYRTRRDRTLLVMAQDLVTSKNPSKELLNLLFVEIQPDSPNLNLLVSVADIPAKHCNVETLKWFLEKICDDVHGKNVWDDPAGELNYSDRCLWNSYQWNNLPSFQYLLDLHKTQLQLKLQLKLQPQSDSEQKRKQQQRIDIHLDNDRMFYYPRDHYEPSENTINQIKPNLESVRTLYRHFLYNSANNIENVEDFKEVVQRTIELSKTTPVLASTKFRPEQAGIFNMLGDVDPQNPDECILTLWLQGIDLSTHPRFSEREQVLKRYRARISEELIDTKLLIMPLLEISLQFV